MNRLDEWSKGGSQRKRGSFAKGNGDLQKRGCFAKGNGVLQKRGSFAGKIVMFCQKAVVFAALVCFVIIWGGLVIVAQSETLSDLIKNGFRKGLLLTGQAEDFVRAVMLLVTAILILVLFKAVFGHLNRAGKRRLYIDSAVLLVLMLVIYVFFLTQLRIIPTTDARSITDQAYTLAKTGAQSMDEDSVYANYFSKYSNNYPFALFLTNFFRVLLAIGITDIWLPLYLLNMAGLLLGALFTWLTARRVLGLRAAVKVQLLMTLCPVYYLMMFWVYTATLSVPFVTGMIYLAVCIHDLVMGKTQEVTMDKASEAATGQLRDAVPCPSHKVTVGKTHGSEKSTESGSRKRLCCCRSWLGLVVLSVLAGLLCSLGFLLRATNAIVVIAIVIYIVFFIIRRTWMFASDGDSRKPESEQNSDNNKKLGTSEADHLKIRNADLYKNPDIGRVYKRKNRSTIIRGLAACLVAVFVAAGSYVSIHSACMDYFASVSDGNYPITHWLMMGSHDNGMYNVEDDRFTFHLETGEEKKEATWAQTVENYREAGVVGTLKLIGKKMIINWSDGYFAMDLRLEQSMKYSPVYTYIAGNHNDAFHLYCQGYWLAIGVLVIVACVRLLRMKSIPMLPFLLVLTLFGAIVFYWFWEVKPAYALPFLYIFYLLAVCGQVRGEYGAHKVVCKRRTEGSERNQSISEKIAGESAVKADAPENERQGIETREIAKRKMVSNGRHWLFGYIVVIFLGIEYLYNDTVNSAKPYYDYSIRCAQKSWLIQIAMEDGDTVTQEFYPNADFNRIVLSVAVSESEKESEAETGNASGGTPACLHVTLQDAEGNVVYAGMITREDINSENRVILKVGEQTADAEGGYLLSITKEIGSFGDLNLRTRKGIHLNAYKGDFHINGVLQGTDLYMQVYRYYEEEP